MVLIAPPKGYLVTPQGHITSLKVGFYLTVDSFIFINYPPFMNLVKDMGAEDLFSMRISKLAF